MAAAAAGLMKIFEDMCGGAAQFESGFGGDRLDVGCAAHAVGAKNFSWIAHGCFDGFSAAGGMTVTVTSGGSTS